MFKGLARCINIMKKEKKCSVEPGDMLMVRHRHECFYCTQAEVAWGYYYSTVLGNKSEILVHFRRLGLSKERPKNRC